VPSGRVISPVKVPVAWVTTVIQSPVPNQIGYGSLYTCMPREVWTRDYDGCAGLAPSLGLVSVGDPAPEELDLVG
jgi:hypothetical protein